MPGRSTDSVQLIDPGEFRLRRVTLGLTMDQIADELGVSHTVVRNLEHGTDQAHYSLGFCAALARLLGCALTELLTPTSAPPPGDTLTASDARELGRVLMAAGGSALVDHLSEALGWTRERTMLAIDRLDVLLNSAGQRVVTHVGSQVTIVPAYGVDAPVRTARRRDIEVAGVYASEAALLHEVITKGNQYRFDGTDMIAVARLRGAGLLTTDALPQSERANSRSAEGARLTPEARYNLLLDEPAP